MTGEGLARVSDDGVGRLVDNRYRLRMRLGDGGMGTVWKATDERLQRDVAVKEPRLEQHLPEAERARIFQRIEREARAAARIRHPGVVEIHDVVMEDGRPWIVMEWVPGQSLMDRLHGGRSLDPTSAAQIALPVLEALSAVHQESVLHRDVKPDNVLITPNGRVVLVDFGIARTDGETRLTQTGGLVGTPNYIAPERAKGQEPGPPADLWSLGVLLFRAVEGWEPFNRGSATRTLDAVKHDPLLPLKCTGPLSELIVDLLKKEPSDRPTVDQVRERLKRVAGLEQGRPKPSPVPPTAVLPLPGGAASDGGRGRASSRWWTRRRNQVLASAVAMAAVIALTLAWSLPSGSGLPDGWTWHTPDGLHVKVGTPDAYSQEVIKDGVAFNDPDKTFSVAFYRETGVQETALATANSTKDSLTREGEGASGRKTDVTNVTIDETTVQSKPAAALGFSYRNRTGADVTTVFHRMDMIVVSDGGVRYWLAISMPSVGEERAKGERLYRDVLDHLEIDDL